MGIVGVIYMCIILMYTLGTLLAGQLTERLVRILQQREKLLPLYVPRLTVLVIYKR